MEKILFPLLWFGLFAITGLLSLSPFPIYGQVPSVGPGKCYGNCPDDRTPPSSEKGLGSVPYQPSDKDRAVETFNQGSRFQAQGQYEEAAKWYREAIRINPRYGKAYNNLGSVYMSLGRQNDAVAQFRRAIELGGSDYAQKNLEIALQWDASKRAKENQRQANALVEKGDYAGAIALLRENIRIYPGAYAHVNLGAVLYRQGKKMEAAAEFRRALALDPSDANARENLARATKEMENQRRMEEAKLKTGQMIDQLIKDSKVAVPADLTFLDPDKPIIVDPGTLQTDKPKPRGLKIKEVPLPPSVAYRSSNPPEKILFQALRSEGSDLKKAIKDLEIYLTKNDPKQKNVNARFALRVLMNVVRAREADPNTPMQKVLLEAIASAGRRPWPGPTKGPDRIPVPGVLREKTTELILDALQTYPGDWQGSFRYLAKLAEDPTYPHREAAGKAHSNLLAIYEETIEEKITK